jgi:hypothetical protein
MACPDTWARVLEFEDEAGVFVGVALRSVNHAAKASAERAIVRTHAGIRWLRRQLCRYADCRRAMPWIWSDPDVTAQMGPILASVSLPAILHGAAVVNDTAAVRVLARAATGHVPFGEIVMDAIENDALQAVQLLVELMPTPSARMRNTYYLVAVLRGLDSMAAVLRPFVDPETIAVVDNKDDNDVRVSTDTLQVLAAVTMHTRSTHFLPLLLRRFSDIDDGIWFQACLDCVAQTLCIHDTAPDLLYPHIVTVLCSLPEHVALSLVSGCPSHLGGVRVTIEAAGHPAPRVFEAADARWPIDTCDEVTNALRSFLRTPRPCLHLVRRFQARIGRAASRVIFSHAADSDVVGAALILPWLFVRADFQGYASVADLANRPAVLEWLYTPDMSAPTRTLFRQAVASTHDRTALSDEILALLAEWREEDLLVAICNRRLGRLRDMLQRRRVTPEDVGRGLLLRIAVAAVHLGHHLTAELLTMDELWGLDCVTLADLRPALARRGGVSDRAVELFRSH